MNEIIGGKVYLVDKPLSEEVEMRLKKQGLWGVGIFDQETDKVYFKNIGEPKPLSDCKFVVGLNKFKEGVEKLLKSKGIDVYAS